MTTPSSSPPSMRPSGSRPRERRTEGREEDAILFSINSDLLLAAAMQALTPPSRSAMDEILAAFRDPQPVLTAKSATAADLPDSLPSRVRIHSLPIPDAGACGAGLNHDHNNQPAT